MNTPPTAERLDAVVALLATPFVVAVLVVVACAVLYVWRAR